MDYTGLAITPTNAPTDSNYDVPRYSGEVPLYQYAADNHNYGNGNFAVTDPSTWGEGLSNAGKFIVTAAVSGANSFYTTGVAVGNFFGLDAKAKDTADVLASLDSDLGAYYQENREYADLAGFMISSLVPGIGGVKLLNAGQRSLKAAVESGRIGGNLSKATGLLIPKAEEYAAKAAAEIAQSSATFSWMNANTLNAIRAGVGQAALESAAFETAVAATMFKSPVLDEADGWDIAKNIATGTVVGGAIGGVFSAAKTYGTIKALIKKADEAEKPFTHITELPGASPADRIIQAFDDLDIMPSAPVEGEFASKFSRLRGNKEDKLNNNIRTAVHEMTVGKDTEIANQLADAIKGLDSRQIASNFLYADELGRLSQKLKVEKELSAAEKKLIKSGAADIMNTSGAATIPKKVGYIKLLGDDIGKVYFDAPKVLTLADTLANEAEVIAYAKNAGFKEKALWSALETRNHLEAEARYIWADKFAKVSDGMVIHEHDIPLLEKAVAAKLSRVTVKTSDGYEYAITSADDLLKHVQVSKQEVAWNLLKGKQAGTGISTEEIAKITNTKLSYLEGELKGSLEDSLFARQAFQRDYTQSMVDKGLWSQSKGMIDTSVKPSWMKMSYRIDELQDANGMLLEGMAAIKAKAKLYQQAVDNVFAKYATDIDARFYHPDESLILKANRFGAGPGLFSFANGNYHSLESWAEQIGGATAALRKSIKDATSERLQVSAYKLANNQAAAIEFETINQTIASSSEKYVLNDAGDALLPRSLKRYHEEIAKGNKNAVPPKLQENAPLEIKIKNPETREAISVHIEVNGKRITGYKELRAVQGAEDSKDAATFYPIRPNPKDYPHFAFVVDPSVTGAGHVKMIHAAAPKELEAMIEKVPSKFKVITKGQSEEFHQALGDYQYERTLHENYIDSELKSQGINSQFFVKTDPQKITQDWVESHLRSDDVFARELVNAKFEKEFGELRALGETYTNVAGSKYGGSYRYAENVTKNPYLNYVKTALDISQLNEHPLLIGFNTLLDGAFSKAMNVVSTAFSQVKGSSDLDQVNALLKQYGVKSAYYDTATELLANHSAPKGELVKFVRGVNSILSTLTLRLDPLNSINNAVGATVLLGAETKSLLRAIAAGNPEVAGELATAFKLKIPGTEEAIRSPSKLIGNSMKRFFSPESEELLKQYKANGWVTDLTSQYKSMLDDITLSGKETASILSQKLNAALDKGKRLADMGEKATGNKLAEEFNRFVAADVMKQISDFGVKAGVITQKEQLSYINTFVNRTQGNILASQRPLMFQGAIGQAVGLFQTYQFNLMQQLFRHVSEGSVKDAAIMMGLQGTIYGMNGLPAFNFMNTHIIGTASGNPEHTDAYTATYGIAGKEVGDWLLYGVPSNLLRTNLYTRGDINPRQVTIIPTNPADIPLVNATVKTYENIKNVLAKIGAGSNVWETILQGIEHNGLSRPLAGLAQTAQAFTNGDYKAYSTSSKGNILGANDLLSLATISRLAGGKPFDEAIVNDATYRITAYQAADRAKKETLTEALKSTVIGGHEPTQDQVESFAEQYAKLGGKQGEFNKWMLKQIKEANTSQANKIMQHLNSPYSQNMQRIMGGRAVEDGTDF